jgi:hypothetical protein
VDSKTHTPIFAFYGLDTCLSYGISGELEAVLSVSSLFLFAHGFAKEWNIVPGVIPFFVSSCGIDTINLTGQYIVVIVHNFLAKTSSIW